MKNLTLLSKEELLTHAKNLVEEDRKISLQLIEVLRECEKRMLFSELGYGSLWEFAVKHLGLSEGSAQLRISTMRLARDNPGVQDALESGKLSLSNAAQLHSFFQSERKQGKAHTPESKKEIIASVSGLSKKECERQLFALAPESIPQEKERTVSDTKTELKLILDNGLLEKLQRLKELLAHKFPHATYGELIEYLADKTLERLERAKAGPKKMIQDSGSLASLTQDPSGKQEPAPPLKVPRPEEVTKPKSLSTQGQKINLRTYIPIFTQQTLWRRAGGQCEHVTNDGIRCKSRFKLELDHIVALAAGGTNHISNLRYVCRSHNLFQAKQTFGSQILKTYVPSLR